MSVTATAKSFRKTIGFSLLGGIAFTLLQACWPITSQSFGATSGPATSTLGLAGEGGADPIDAEINAARAKLKAAEDELTKAKDVETEAKKLTPPETPANKLKKDEAGKALETAEKTVADHKQTLKNAEDAKRLKMEANKSDPRLPWVWRFLANTGLVFSLQLVVFLSQQKEMAGILRVFAEQIGIKWNELPKDEPMDVAIASALPAIRQEKEQAVAEKSRLESELAAISRRMERLRLGPVKDSDDRLCRVLLLGKGDTGKTELIYHLLRYRGDHVDRPIRNNKTYEIRSYSMLHQASFRGVTQPPDVFQASAIELIDYRGQGTSEFFRDLIEQRHEPDHCDFDIIILIVDLFKTPEVKSLAVGKQLEPEQSRIAEQVGHWDADRLSGFVKLSERLKYFCLLINKCDMLETMSTAYDKAFEGYKELRECIKTVGVRNFELVACSLREGWMQHNVEDMPEQDGGIYPFLISRMVGNSTQVRKAERVV